MVGGLEEDRHRRGGPGPELGREALGRDEHEVGLVALLDRERLGVADVPDDVHLPTRPAGAAQSLQLDADVGGATVELVPLVGRPDPHDVTVAPQRPGQRLGEVDVAPPGRHLPVLLAVPLTPINPY